jgi:hypothetical protein
VAIETVAVGADHEGIARLFAPELQAPQLASLKLHVRVAFECSLHRGAVVTPDLLLVFAEMKIGMHAQ